MNSSTDATDRFRTLEGGGYVSLRTHRADGRAIDTPMWFAPMDGAVVMRTPAASPKVGRIRARPDVGLRSCDWRGAPVEGSPVIPGHAVVLDGPEAERGNAVLHRRYGWRWNVVPMIPLPGVKQADHGLSVRGRVGMMRHRSLWPTSLIIRVDPVP